MQYDKNNPFEATLLSRERISSADSKKNTQYLVFDLADSKLEYEPGDVLAVLPKNDEKEVDEILDIVNFDQKSVVINNETVFLKDAFQESVCITHLTKKFLQFIVKNIVNKNEQHELNDVLNDKERCELFIQSNTLLTIIKKYNIKTLIAQTVVDFLKKLTPRLYSIASSFNAKGNKLYLLVGALQFEHENGFVKYGVASNYLNIRLNIGDKAKIWMIPSKFKLPEDYTKNVILIGPGTGLAPFISFIEEREWQKTLGKNIGRTWLFFGDQHEKKEFYLRDKIFLWVKKGILTNLDLAFSRDSLKRIYVQDRLLEHKQEIFNWINGGGYIYVCGDAKRMAADVDLALKKIIKECGNLTQEDDVEAYIKNLKANKRYQRDVY